MRKQRKSKLLDGIIRGLANVLTAPISVADVNNSCDNLLEKSPAFLPKHAKDNPGDYTAFWKDWLKENIN